MNNNIIDHLQPTTILQRFYPTEANTTNNPLGVSDEAVEAMRANPIRKRRVSCFDTTPIINENRGGIFKSIYNVLTEVPEYLVAEIMAIRNEPSFIARKQMEDGLPIYTPCCVLCYHRSSKTYYPINYTCLLDFDILQDDNPNIDFVELKPALEALRHIYYCGRATNGIDLFCIVPISTPQRYAAHARALIHQFKKQGIIIRVADSITHTRTLSSDPSGYFNENAAEFTKFWD